MRRLATTDIRLGGGGVTARVAKVGDVPDGTDTTRLLMTLADYLGSATPSLDRMCELRADVELLYREDGGKVRCGVAGTARARHRAGPVCALEARARPL